MDGQSHHYPCSFESAYGHQHSLTVSGWFASHGDYKAWPEPTETADTLRDIKLPPDFLHFSSLMSSPKEAPINSERSSKLTHDSAAEIFNAWTTGLTLDAMEGSRFSQGDMISEAESTENLEPRYGLRFPISNGEIDRLAWVDLAEELRTDILTRFINWGKSQPFAFDDISYAVFQPKMTDIYDTLTRTHRHGSSIKDIGDGVTLTVRPKSEHVIRKQFLSSVKEWVAKQESDWCHPPIYMDPVSYYLEFFDNRLILRFHIQLPREEVDRTFCDTHHILYPEKFSRWEFCEDCFCKRREVLASRRSSGLPTCYCWT